MSLGINHRLRVSLFESPPPVSNALFKRLFCRMFPDVDAFVRFLSTSSYDEQCDISVTILLRLSHESDLPPTNRLLLNLLAFEANQTGQHSKELFVGRDHFVHLTYLYLLGLYIFWYHERFHSALVSHFSFSVTGSPQSIDDYQAAHNFLSAWTGFVLIHDVGYPIEGAFSGNSNTSYVKPLTKLDKNLEKELALRCISRLMALSALCHSRPMAFEDSYSRQFKSGYFNNAVKQPELFSKSLDIAQWHNAIRMPTGTGMSLLPMLESIAPLSDILAVIESARDRIPLFLYSMSSKAALRLMPAQKGSLGQDAQYLALQEAITCSATTSPASKDFEIVFYVRNFAESFLKSKLAACDSDKGTLSQFESLTQAYMTSHPLPFSLAEPYRDFNDCSFHFYYAVLRDMDYIADDDERTTSVDDLAAQWNAGARAIGQLENRLTREIAAYFNDVLRRRSRTLKAEGISLSERGLEGYLDLLLNSVLDKRTTVQSLTRKLTSQLKTQVDIDSKLRKVFKSVRLAVSKEYSLPRNSEDTPINEFLGRLKAESLSNSSEHLFQRVLNRFEVASKLSREKVIDYRPDYIPPNSSFMDHGVFASLIGFRIATTVLHGVPNENETNVIPRLCFARTHSQKALEAEGQLKMIFENVLYSVLVHNIYPHNLGEEGESFRTRPQDNPFAYFALFCDSLQTWDRRRLINPAYSKRIRGTSANQFDIEIRGATLYIYENKEGLNIEDRNSALRKNLDTFLEGASCLVRVKLSDFGSHS